MRIEEAKKEARGLAEDHVDWFLEVIRPLLIEFMVHGAKHGFELCQEGRDDGKRVDCMDDSGSPFIPGRGWGRVDNLEG